MSNKKMTDEQIFNFLMKYDQLGPVFNDEYEVVGFSWSLYKTVVDLNGRKTELKFL